MIIFILLIFCTSYLNFRNLLAGTYTCLHHGFSSHNCLYSYGARRSCSHPEEFASAFVKPDEEFFIAWSRRKPHFKRILPQEHERKSPASCHYSKTSDICSPFQMEFCFLHCLITGINFILRHGTALQESSLWESFRGAQRSHRSLIHATGA